MVNKVFVNRHTHLECLCAFPEKLLAFSDAQRNKDKRKTGIKDDADSSFVFGATKSDMKTFDAAQGNKALSEEAEKHGGQLNMEQMMRLAGHDV